MRLNNEQIFQQVADQQMSIQQALACLEENSSGFHGTQYPLSEGQKALWVIDQLAPQNYAYNIPLAFWIQHEIDIPALQQAFQIISDRHPSLRTVFGMDGPTPVQRVLENPAIDFRQEDASKDSDEEILRKLKVESQKPFDLSRGPLMRIVLYSITNQKQVLLITFHHIIVDGVSLSLILKELEIGYLAQKSGTTGSYPVLEAAYDDFVKWQKQMLRGPEGRSLREFWEKQLAGEIEPLELLTDKPRPVTPSYQGSSLSMQLPAPLYQKLNDLALANNVTRFTVMLAAFKVLLHRYTHQEDILTGVPVLARPDTAFDNVVGYFSNMIVIRSNPKPDTPFDSFMKQLHETVLDAFEHSAYPLYTLVEALGKSSTDLFQVAFAYQNWVKEMASTESDPNRRFTPEPLPQIQQEGVFDITLEIYEGLADVSLSFKYNTDIFETGTIERMSGHYLQILADVAGDSSKTLSRIAMLTPAEEHRILVEWNATQGEYPQQCVHELFAGQAAAHPETPAVLFEGQQLSYGELDQKSSQLAAYLVRKGVTRGNMVGVFMERSLEMIIALFGILKAGCAYIPVDPASPADRLTYMFEDTGLKFMITQASLENKIPAQGLTLVTLDREWDPAIGCIQNADQDPQLADQKAGFQDWAYVIYTSGSTGKPKGVRVRHSGLTNLLWSMAKRPGIYARDHVMAMASISFDLSILEIFLPLTAGAKIEMLPADIAKDGLKLKERLEKCEATVIMATPATWQMLVAAGWKSNKAERIWCGGDTLTQELAGKLLEQVKEVWNLFGPTETSVLCTISAVKSSQRVDVGLPIHNTQLYILDKQLNPVPAGVSGELYIGGDGVAGGCYLNRTEANREKFIANPFGPKDSVLYKTGDAVRYLPDGSLDFLHRIDNMVKFRGYRIELEEIETVLLKIDGIKEAAVVVREDSPGHKQLVAFLIGKDASVLGRKTQLPGLMKQWLPSYMVPAVFVWVKSLPLTLSRKIDRKTLSTLKMAEIEAKYGMPEAGNQTAVESKVEIAPRFLERPKKKAQSINDRLLQLISNDLVEIAAGVLKINPHEMNITNDIKEYGFDSIRMVTLSIALNQKFQVEISPSVLFEYPTIEKLAFFLVNNYYDSLKQLYSAQLAEPIPREYASPQALDFTSAAHDEPGQIQVPVRGFGTNETVRNMPVAIIGISGRMPQSNDVNAFWENLRSGKNLVSRIPSTRFEGSGIPDHGEESLFHWGGIIDGFDGFDAAFFNIPAGEAESMDPQLRLFLETVWQAMEDSGHKPSSYAKAQTGVFAGLSQDDYQNPGSSKKIASGTGSSYYTFANHVSSWFNLRGPSVTIQSAGSGSLLAIHRAVNAIRNGDCNTAIAGGVHLLINPLRNETSPKSLITGTDGECRVFDKSAGGYVWGEGVGVLILKALDAAEVDGDHIYAVIPGSAENYMKRPNPSMAANTGAQIQLITAVYDKTRIDPSTIGYLEANGVGTVLEDANEINALKESFAEIFNHQGKSLPSEAYCGIGSVKSNIGHLDAAAGIAGVLKILLALKNQTIPATIHVTEANPNLKLEGSPFYLATETRAWEPIRDEQNQTLPRRAGISSFGLDGANVHICIEEYQRDTLESPVPVPESQLMVFSARDEERLKRYAQGFLEYLHQNAGSISLREMAYTLQVGREAMAERLAIIASSVGELQDCLQAFCHDGSLPSRAYRGNTAKSDLRANFLLDGEEGEEFLQNIIVHRRFSKIARLWTGGVEIDWTLMYSCKPHRVPLPPVPFVRQRYWKPRDLQDGFQSTQPIAVLGMKDRVPDDQFINVWKELKEGKTRPQFTGISIAPDYIRLKTRYDKKMLHLMVSCGASPKKMEVIVSGSGKPVLLIPGFGLTAPQWIHQIKEWSAKYQVFVIHAPGVGQSELCGELTYADIGRIFMEVMAVMGVEDRIHVMGSSFGGMVAQSIAKDYPERVFSLTLAGSACDLDLGSENYIMEMLEKDFANIGAGREYQFFLDSGCLAPEAGAKYWEVFKKTKLSTADILKGIQTPTLIMAGSEDLLVSKEQSGMLHQGISNSEYYEIKGAGHGLNLTHSQEFNRKVLEFIMIHEK